MRWRTIESNLNEAKAFEYLNSSKRAGAADGICFDFLVAVTVWHYNNKHKNTSRFDIRNGWNLLEVYLKGNLNALPAAGESYFDFSAESNGVIHGGGWTGGDPQRQARDLYHTLALDGWASLGIRYPFTPHVTVEDQIAAVRDAVRWARTRLHAPGIEPSTVVLAGGSAGGHLALMAGLQLAAHALPLLRPAW